MAISPITRSRRKFNTVRRREYIKLLEDGHGRVASAAGVGVSYHIVLEARKVDAAFAAECELAEMNLDDTVVTALYRNATQNDNIMAQMFWLQNRRPGDWQDRRGSSTQVNVQVKTYVDFPMEDV
jgi:hypothetical protein